MSLATFEAHTAAPDSPATCASGRAEPVNGLPGSIGFLLCSAGYVLDTALVFEPLGEVVTVMAMQG